MRVAISGFALALIMSGTVFAAPSATPQGANTQGANTQGGNSSAGNTPGASIPAEAARGAGSAALPSGGYGSEADAKGHCPGDTVVWVNLTSKAYHLAGDKWYGKSKHGDFMCQKAADAAGMHLAGKHAVQPNATTKG